MATRSEVASDTFDSSIDSSWDNGPGGFGTLSFQTGGHIKADSVDTRSALRRNTGTYDDDQYSIITIQAHGDGDSFNTIGPIARYQAGTTQQCYAGEILATNTIISVGNRIQEYPSSGSPTELTSGGVDRDLSAGDTVVLEVEGSTITMFSNESGGGETQLLQTTDSTITGGRPGVYISYDVSADTDCMITAWSGGDLVADGISIPVAMHGYRQRHQSVV